MDILGCIYDTLLNVPLQRSTKVSQSVQMSYRKLQKLTIYFINLANTRFGIITAFNSKGFNLL